MKCNYHRFLTEFFSEPFDLASGFDYISAKDISFGLSLPLSVVNSFYCYLIVKNSSLDSEVARDRLLLKKLCDKIFENPWEKDLDYICEKCSRERFLISVFCDKERMNRIFDEQIQFKNRICETLDFQSVKETPPKCHDEKVCSECNDKDLVNKPFKTLKENYNDKNSKNKVFPSNYDSQVPENKQKIIFEPEFKERPIHSFDKIKSRDINREESDKNGSSRFQKKQNHLNTQFQNNAEATKISFYGVCDSPETQSKFLLHEKAFLKSISHLPTSEKNLSVCPQNASITPEEFRIFSKDSMKSENNLNTCETSPGYSSKCKKGDFKTDRLDKHPLDRTLLNNLTSSANKKLFYKYIEIQDNLETTIDSSDLDKTSKCDCFIARSESNTSEKNTLNECLYIFENMFISKYDLNILKNVLIVRDIFSNFFQNPKWESVGLLSTFVARTNLYVVYAPIIHSVHDFLAKVRLDMLFDVENPFMNYFLDFLVLALSILSSFLNQFLWLGVESLDRIFFWEFLDKIITNSAGYIMSAENSAFSKETKNFTFKNSQKTAKSNDSIGKFEKEYQKTENENGESKNINLWSESGKILDGNTGVENSKQQFTNRNPENKTESNDKNLKGPYDQEFKLNQTACSQGLPEKYNKNKVNDSEINAVQLNKGIENESLNDTIKTSSKSDECVSLENEDVAKYIIGDSFKKKESDIQKAKNSSQHIKNNFSCNPGFDLSKHMNISSKDPKSDLFYNNIGPNKPRSSDFETRTNDAVKEAFNTISKSLNSQKINIIDIKLRDKGFYHLTKTLIRKSLCLFSLKCTNSFMKNLSTVLKTFFNQMYSLLTDGDIPTPDILILFQFVLSSLMCTDSIYFVVRTIEMLFLERLFFLSEDHFYGLICLVIENVRLRSNNYLSKFLLELILNKPCLIYFTDTKRMDILEKLHLHLTCLSDDEKMCIVRRAFSKIETTLRISRYKSLKDNLDETCVKQLSRRCDDKLMNNQKACFNGENTKEYKAHSEKNELHKLESPFNNRIMEFANNKEACENQRSGGLDLQKTNEAHIKKYSTNNIGQHNNDRYENLSREISYGKGHNSANRILKAYCEKSHKNKHKTTPFSNQKSNHVDANLSLLNIVLEYLSYFTNTFFQLEIQNMFLEVIFHEKTFEYFSKFICLNLIGIPSGFINRLSDSLLLRFYHVFFLKIEMNRVLCLKFFMKKKNEKFLNQMSLNEKLAHNVHFSETPYFFLDMVPLITDFCFLDSSFYCFEMNLLRCSAYFVYLRDSGLYTEFSIDKGAPHEKSMIDQRIQKRPLNYNKVPIYASNEKLYSPLENKNGLYDNKSEIPLSKAVKSSFLENRDSPDYTLVSNKEIIGLKNELLSGTGDSKQSNEELSKQIEIVCSCYLEKSVLISSKRMLNQAPLFEIIRNFLLAEIDNFFLFSIIERCERLCKSLLDIVIPQNVPLVSSKGVFVKEICKSILAEKTKAFDAHPFVYSRKILSNENNNFNGIKKITSNGLNNNISLQNKTGKEHVLSSSNLDKEPCLLDTNTFYPLSTTKKDPPSGNSNNDQVICVIKNNNNDLYLKRSPIPAQGFHNTQIDRVTRNLSFNYRYLENKSFNDTKIRKMIEKHCLSFIDFFLQKPSKALCSVLNLIPRLPNSSEHFHSYYLVVLYLLSFDFFSFNFFYLKIPSLVNFVSYSFVDNSLLKDFNEFLRSFSSNFVSGGSGARLLRSLFVVDRCFFCDECLNNCNLLISKNHNQSRDIPDTKIIKPTAAQICEGKSNILYNESYALKIPRDREQKCDITINGNREFNISQNQNRLRCRKNIDRCSNNVDHKNCDNGNLNTEISQELYRYHKSNIFPKSYNKSENFPPYDSKPDFISAHVNEFLVSELVGLLNVSHDDVLSAIFETSKDSQSSHTSSKDHVSLKSLTSPKAPTTVHETSISPHKHSSSITSLSSQRSYKTKKPVSDKTTTHISFCSKSDVGLLRPVDDSHVFFYCIGCFRKCISKSAISRSFDEFDAFGIVSTEFVNSELVSHFKKLISKDSIKRVFKSNVHVVFGYTEIRKLCNFDFSGIINYITNPNVLDCLKDNIFDILEVIHFCLKNSGNFFEKYAIRLLEVFIEGFDSTRKCVLVILECLVLLDRSLAYSFEIHLAFNRALFCAGKRFSKSVSPHRCMGYNSHYGMENSDHKKNTNQNPGSDYNLTDMKGIDRRVASLSVNSNIYSRRADSDSFVNPLKGIKSVYRGKIDDPHYPGYYDGVNDDRERSRVVSNNPDFSYAYRNRDVSRNPDNTGSGKNRIENRKDFKNNGFRFGSENLDIIDHNIYSSSQCELDVDVKILERLRVLYAKHFLDVCMSETPNLYEFLICHVCDLSAVQSIMFRDQGSLSEKSRKSAQKFQVMQDLQTSLGFPCNIFCDEMFGDYEMLQPITEHTIFAESQSETENSYSKEYHRRMLEYDDFYSRKFSHNSCASKVYDQKHHQCNSCRENFIENNFSGVEHSGRQVYEPNNCYGGNDSIHFKHSDSSYYPISFEKFTYENSIDQPRNQNVLKTTPIHSHISLLDYLMSINFDSDCLVDVFLMNKHNDKIRFLIIYLIKKRLKRAFNYHDLYVLVRIYNCLQVYDISYTKIIRKSLMRGLDFKLENIQHENLIDLVKVGCYKHFDLCCEHSFILQRLLQFVNTHDQVEHTYNGFHNKHDPISHKIQNFLNHSSANNTHVFINNLQNAFNSVKNTQQNVDFGDSTKLDNIIRNLCLKLAKFRTLERSDTSSSNTTFRVFYQTLELYSELDIHLWNIPSNIDAQCIQCGLKTKNTKYLWELEHTKWVIHIRNTKILVNHIIQDTIYPKSHNRYILSKDHVYGNNPQLNNDNRTQLGYSRNDMVHGFTSNQNSRLNNYFTGLPLYPDTVIRHADQLFSRYSYLRSNYSFADFQTQQMREMLVDDLVGLSKSTTGFFSFFFANLHSIISNRNFVQKLPERKLFYENFQEKHLAKLHNEFQTDFTKKLALTSSKNLIEHQGFLINIKKPSITDTIIILQNDANKQIRSNALSFLRNMNITFHTQQIVQCLNTRNSFEEIAVILLTMVGDKILANKLIWELRAYRELSPDKFGKLIKDIQNTTIINELQQSHRMNKNSNDKILGEIDAARNNTRSDIDQPVKDRIIENQDVLNKHGCHKNSNGLSGELATQVLNTKRFNVTNYNPEDSLSLSKQSSTSALSNQKSSCDKYDLNIFERLSSRSPKNAPPNIENTNNLYQDFYTRGEDFMYTIKFFDLLTEISAVMLTKKDLNKQMRSKKINELLRNIRIENSVLLPTDPKYEIVAIQQGSARALQSYAKVPYIVTFMCVENVLLVDEKYTQALIQIVKECQKNDISFDKPQNGTNTQKSVFETGSFEFDSDADCNLDCHRRAFSAENKQSLKLCPNQNVANMETNVSKIENTTLVGQSPSKKINEYAYKSELKMNNLKKLRTIQLNEFNMKRLNIIKKRLILKAGDDCRQDMLALQLIETFARIFKKCNLDLFLYPYKVIATSSTTGIIEVIENALTRDEIGKERINNLSEYFRFRYGYRESIKHKKAIENFTKSFAAYSLATYFLNIKDRHNANIMVTDDGHIIHIDFGFILENTPNLNIEYPIKLTTEMYTILVENNAFEKYKELVTKGFFALRQNQKDLVFMVDAFKNSGLPCFTKNTMRNFISRFRMDLDNQRAKEFIAKMVDKGIKGVRNWIYDKYQNLLNDIQH